jgi:hypothetical protein
VRTLWVIEAGVYGVEADPLRPANRRHCPVVDQAGGGVGVKSPRLYHVGPPREAPKFSGVQHPLLDELPRHPAVRRRWPSCPSVRS